jgi:hypothetical protein
MLEEDKANDAVLFGNTALTTGAISDASNIPYTYQNTIQLMIWVVLGLLDMVLLSKRNVRIVLEVNIHQYQFLMEK